MYLDSLRVAHARSAHTYPGYFPRDYFIIWIFFSLKMKRQFFIIIKATSAYYKDQNSENAKEKNNATIYNPTAEGKPPPSAFRPGPTFFSLFT